jgi:hypothetical protein
MPIKSKARARIISIETPAKFRKSIKEIYKDRYTVGDQKALQLARNRAKAQLKRRNLSGKEREEFTEITKTKIPKAKIKGKTLGIIMEKRRERL